MREDNQKTFCDPGSSNINLKLNFCSQNFVKERNNKINYFEKNIKRRRINKKEILLNNERKQQKINFNQTKLINNNRRNLNLKIKNQDIINRIKRRNSISTHFYSNILIFITFGTFLALFSFISTADGSNTKSNEIDVDWTLGTTTGSNNSNITKQQNNNNNKYSSILHPKVLTKYLFLKDVLRFHCPTDKHLAIHLVPAESAILCHLPELEPQNGLAPIGFCGPNSGSDPRLIIRRYSPLPGKPSFREGNAYFFISTSNGSPNGTSQTSGGLCRTEGLRLRIIVLPSPSNNAPLKRPADEWTDLAHLLMPIIIPTSLPPSETSTTTIPPPKASALSSNDNSVFPAILSLEQGGQRHKVLVHSQRELTDQLNAVSTNVGRKIKNEEERDVDVDIDEKRGQQRHMVFGEEKQKYNQKQDSSLYELMDGRTNKWPGNRSPQTEDFGESKEEEERHLRRRRPVPKTARSPDPLVESQKLVYIIGYDGHGNVGGTSSSSTNKTVNRNILLFMLIITILLCYCFLAISFSLN
ncbi:hypothetical protein ACQ4LE_006955 [Meloidogyne hapla]